MIVFCIGEFVDLPRKTQWSHNDDFCSVEYLQLDFKNVDAAFPKGEFQYYYTYQDAVEGAMNRFPRETGTFKTWTEGLQSGDECGVSEARPIFAIRVNPDFEKKKSSEQKNEIERILDSKGVIKKIYAKCFKFEFDYTTKSEKYYKIMLNTHRRPLFARECKQKCIEACEAYINSGFFSNRHHKSKAKGLIERINNITPNKTDAVRNELSQLFIDEESKLKPEEKNGDYGKLLEAVIICLQEYYPYHKEKVHESIIKPMLNAHLKNTEGLANLILSYQNDDKEDLENTKKQPKK